MARLLGITSEIWSQDDCAPVLGEGLRQGARANSCHVLCREADDECCKVFGMKYSNYLTPDLPHAWYRKCQLTSTKYFRKHNFHNVHVASYENYENLEPYDITFAALGF